MDNMRNRWMVGSLAFALALAGCGADDEPAAEVAADCEVGEVDGDLSFFNWSDYMDPELIEAFEEEYGVTVTQDFYPSNEEMLAKVQAGGAQYDVIVPSDYMVSIMIEEELLFEIDRDLVPNYGNLGADFLDPPYDDGSRFSMAYQWGTTGLGVNLAAVGEDVAPTWGLIFDPDLASQYSGRISLLDDPRETMAAALYYLGYSPNSTDEGELQEAADLIAEAKDHVAAFDSDLFADLVLTGETVVSHGFSGGFLDNFGDDEDYAYLIPEEGATVWVDTIAILADTEVPCTAHTFVDFILDAENGAQLTNWTYYASPNEAAEAFIDPEILEDPVIYPTDEVWEHLFFLEDLGDAEILYTDYFTQAKS